ncbi:MAG: GNAT family protein [Actinomycetaceae bacterium]|nr:GNAT family protein [Actinomycetaceae bacterium]
MSFWDRLLSTSRVWGFDERQVRIVFENPTQRGLIRRTPRGSVDRGGDSCLGETSGTPREIRNLTLRPILGNEHRRVERVRWADRAWLEPWEATLPVGVAETLPSLAEYQRKTDAEVADGITLPMMIEADGRVIGVVTASNTLRGALYTTTVGYWIVSDYAGLGISSLAVAAVIDLLLLRLGMHRVEVNIRPENVPSMGLARKLGLTEEGLKPRFMHIAGEWADHVGFSIDRESLPTGGLVNRIWGVPLRWQNA